MTIKQTTSIFCITLSIFFMTALLPVYASADELSEKEKRSETLRFGLGSEIVKLLTTLITEKNTDFTAEIKQIFDKTRDTAVREKIIQYFTVIKDNSLAEYAIQILEDPYDEKKTTVNLVFTYVSELKITEAVNPIVELLKNEVEDYQAQSIRALGKIGGIEEALFLSEYIDRDLVLATKQVLVSALGELQAVETWDKLVEIAQNKDENAFMRAYAAEAIGRMKKTESIPILIQLFEDTDPTIRAAVIRGLAVYDDKEAHMVIIEAFKDSYYKVRIEAASVVKDLKLREAVPYLIYRAKNDPEKAVKSKNYETLAAINVKEGNEYLLSIINDRKLNESIRSEVIGYALTYNFDYFITDILVIAEETLKDDRLKNLRYAIGKELAKYENPKLAGIASAYISHTDVSTKGTGLDIYGKNKFTSVKPQVDAMAADDKMGSLQTKAKRLLE